MERKVTPRRMVENGDVVEYGAFLTPFEDVNMKDARIRVKGMRMPGFYSRFRLKEWQHFGFVGEDFYFGFAIVDAKYMGNSFCYFLDRNTDEKVEHDRISPPGVAKVARDLARGSCGFTFRGYEIQVENRLAEGYHAARVRVKGAPGKPSLSADIEVIEDLEKVEPLELICPLKGNRPAYTHKVACPARGEVVVDGRAYVLREETGVALIDVQKTFFPYGIFWDWATCAGHDAEGRMVALNLSRGINERVEEYHDNCIWVDGKISFLGPSLFTLDENAVLEPWHIETANGTLSLDFTPRGERYGKVDFLVLMSDFHQPFGHFSGAAVDSAGVTHRIEDYFGIVEHHRARF